MMTGNGGISVADALALRNTGTNGEGFGGFGGDSGAWWIIILILLFGRNGFGNNDNGNGNGYGYSPCCTPVTMQGMTDAFNFSQLDNGVRSLANGLCDGFYALNNAIQNCCCQTQLELCQGFGGVNQSIANLGYNMGQGFCGVDKSIMQASFQNQAGFNALGTQIAQCCCDMRYDMASQACDTRNLIQNTTRDIIDNQNCNTRSILDFLVQDKLDTLRAENEELRRAASQDRQNAYLTTLSTQQTAQLINAINPPAIPAYVVPNPNVCGNYGYNFGGCGCGCGCN